MVERIVADEGLKFCEWIVPLARPDAIVCNRIYFRIWVWAYQLQADGTLAHKQKYGWLHGARYRWKMHGAMD